jgi:hypothetical protein
MLAIRFAKDSHSFPNVELRQSDEVSIFNSATCRNSGTWDIKRLAALSFLLPLRQQHSFDGIVRAFHGRKGQDGGVKLC